MSLDHWTDVTVRRRPLPDSVIPVPDARFRQLAGRLDELGPVDRRPTRTASDHQRLIRGDDSVPSG
jgi:hypothetical protein